MYVIMDCYPVHERSRDGADQENPTPGRRATRARYPVHRSGRDATADVSTVPKVAALRGGHVTLAAAADTTRQARLTARRNRRLPPDEGGRLARFWASAAPRTEACRDYAFLSCFV